MIVTVIMIVELDGTRFRMRGNGSAPAPNFGAVGHLTRAMSWRSPLRWMVIRLRSASK